MKNLITDEYRLWLKRFNSKSVSRAEKKISEQLAIELVNIKSIDELADLLAQYINPQKRESKPEEHRGSYLPFNLMTHVSKWHQESIQIIDNVKETRLILDQIEINSKNASLINFLNALLDNPNALLNVHANSLLHLFCQKDSSQRINYVTDLIGYVTDLEPVIRSMPPRPGSFSAETPLNTDHADCLSLLERVAAKYDTDNTYSLWNDANSLLQNSLSIFKDLHEKESTLDSDEEYTDASLKHCCCTLL